MKPKPYPFLKLTDGLIKLNLLQRKGFKKIMRPPISGTFKVWSENSFTLQIGENTYRQPNTKSKYESFVIATKRFYAGDEIIITEPKQGKHLRAVLNLSYATGESQVFEFCSKLSFGESERGCKFIVPINPRLKYTDTAVKEFELKNNTCLECQNCEDEEEETEITVDTDSDTEDSEGVLEVEDYWVATKSDIYAFYPETSSDTFSHSSTNVLTGASWENDYVEWCGEPYIECEAGSFYLNYNYASYKNNYMGIILKGKLGSSLRVKIPYYAYNTIYSSTISSTNKCIISTSTEDLGLSGYISIDLAISDDYEWTNLGEDSEGNIYAGFNASASFDGYNFSLSNMEVLDSDNYALIDPPTNTTFYFKYDDFS